MCDRTYMYFIVYRALETELNRVRSKRAFSVIWPWLDSKGPFNFK